MTERISLTVPNRVDIGDSVPVEVEANSDITYPDLNSVTYELTISTPSSSDDIYSTTVTETEGTTIFESGTWNVGSPKRVTTIKASATITYDDGTESTITDTRDVQIVERFGEDTIVADEGTGNSSASSVNEFYQNRTDFFIDSITYDPDTPATITDRDTASTITFEYKNPDITVDSSARFVKHEIIGGKTLRQKVGKDPIEISVSGVCYRETARRIDGLRYAKTGTIRADRFDGSSLDVQFASATTDPLEEGSAVDFTEANELFNYTIEVTEVR